ncbi:hypothetical protein [Argonema galeatum]|uniref:hypothetical protein n=1 Tax=Argonema galeatum TaxID=2942762 RepID=UPI00201343A9|nr:hypothetical protein [Argonema galeatum]MCL1464427.1 hypothetical protein [Argonema galeatum A003/A1]
MKYTRETRFLKETGFRVPTHLTRAVIGLQAHSLLAVGVSIRIRIDQTVAGLVGEATTMKALPVFDRVLKDLQDHENSTRIKKLIFGACQNTWENDINKLQTFSFQDLLRQLMESNPTIEQLKLTLNKVVQTLNKPGEYGLIANVIISNVSKLYPDVRESTQVVSSGSASTPTPVKLTTEQLPIPQQKSQANPLNPPYDPFALRMEIIKYTNPLRAKVLIFSTLYQQTSFSEQDLITLRAHEFDDLLRKLYMYCDTVIELDARLSSTARCLFEQEENSQAASAIIQAMKPYYANRQPGMYKRQTSDGNSAEPTEMMIESDRAIVAKNHNNLSDGDDSTHQVHGLK